MLSRIPTFKFALSLPLIPPSLAPRAPPSAMKWRSLTVGDLEQGFGDDAAGDVEGLAAVVSHVRALGVRDGQVSALGHGEPAGGLRRLVREE